MHPALLSAFQDETETESLLSPTVGGALILVIGVVLIFLGIRGLRSGVIKDKFGNEFEGGKARLISVVRLALGLFMTGGGIYRLVTG